LHGSQLDDFQQTIEQFFESQDRLTDFGFLNFRVGGTCLECIGHCACSARSMRGS
jgi:hypothetical protein